MEDMRCLLLLFAMIALLGLTGCETGFGGTPQQSIKNLNANEQAQVDQMAASGEISAQEAAGMEQSYSDQNKVLQQTTRSSQESAGNPAGETKATTRN